ncbi:MAG: hypothetical protein M1156_02115, partial [Candidatus Marsarchaeota archaeon]|nr:hypothetical protein [Candidatus Marsarchaeota archaeon]
MKIADISTVIIEGESLSNVVRTNNRIHKEQGWDSTLIAEHYSSFDFVLPYAIKDYFETKTLDPFREFIHSKKSEWFRMALPSKVRYKPKAAYNAIEKANIRVWHLGAFYPLFEHFHRNDIFFFYGITYPFLSHDTNHAFYSYSMMQTIKSLDPRMITISEFIKSDLIKQGFDPGAIRVLPLFHTYN